MKTVYSIEEIKNILQQERRQGNTIGFVPTMGYLHEGHLSLIRSSAKDNDITVISIFVNPTQFLVGEDFEKYPRDIDRDSALASQAGADILFIPGISEMYPDGYCSYVDMDGEITKKLCGASRPGHFKGVCTVVAKLFNIVCPDSAYFGKKDAQQSVIIKKMVQDLNFGINIVVCPIIREQDGLAMSSRNVYLTKEQRNDALILYKALRRAEEMVKMGERDPRELKAAIISILNTAEGAVIDYVECVAEESLKDIDKIEGRVLIALAVKFGNTRLIDNITMEV